MLLRSLGCIALAIDMRRNLKLCAALEGYLGSKLGK